MASPITDRLSTWGEDWIKPVYAAIYRHDATAAQQALDAAANELAGATAGFTEDEALATRYWLIRASYHSARTGLPPEGLDGLLDQTLAGLDELGTNGPVTNYISVHFRLEILIAADRDGNRELSAEEFNALFNRIPREEVTAAIWYTVATWCFDHGQIELLREAYVVIVQAHQMDLKQFPFRRIKLMYQLLDGAIRDEDIIHYLKHLEFHNAFEEFERFILPVIEEQNLDTEQVRRMIAATRERFAESNPVSPY